MTRTGLILDERYRLDKRIAAGGVGQVWRATDLLLGRPVAVKVLRPEYADHPDTLDRFRKEAMLAGALSHPHVAQVFDYGPGSAHWPPYLVMEFVDGPSLADLLAADPIAPVVALDVISQAADGLAGAHKAGLVHRDVKPGNILISSEGQVKVTDFGIAHAAGQTPITGPGLVMGTTQYMAPERIAGATATPASDVYALGIVLHECLTGVPPFEGSPADVMAAHLYLPLPPLPADVPPELDSLVARLTVKDPARRIGNAREVAEMAARLRDAIASGALVPPARAASQSGPGAAAVADQVPLAAAALASGRDHGGPASPAGSDGAAAMAAMGPVGAGIPGGVPVGVSLYETSDEWTVPARMSVPASPGAFATGAQPRQPQRRHAGVLAVGAAVVTATALGGLLVSGAFSSAPSGSPATSARSSAAGAPTLGKRPSPASKTSGASRPAAGLPGTSLASAPGASGTPTGQGGKKGSPSPSPHASTSASASTSPTQSGSPSGSPTGTSPSPTPTTSSGGSPTTSPTPSPSSSCFLGVCL